MTVAGWSQRRERGSSALVRFMLWLSLNFGWATGQLLVYPIALYFCLFSPAARTASRGFLGRVLPGAPNAADILRHFFTYSCVLFDRIFLLSNRIAGFSIEAAGVADVTAALGQSRGCLLFGAHLGSFEALRCFRRQSPVPVKVLMFRGNGGAYTELMDALDPSLREDTIEIGTPDAMLRVRESLQRGEMVGILADRAPHGDKMLTVPFLGAAAAFPTGPMQLAAALDVPIVLFFGIRTGPRCYKIQFEHFADRIVVDRRNRLPETAIWLQRYASRLEHYCRLYPFNWFNFYDFWHGHSAPSPTPQPAALGHAVFAGDTGSDRGRLSITHR